jgi:hypothetical protein
MIVMTFATSSMTEGIFGQGHRPLHDSLQNEQPLQPGGAVFVPWHHHSGKLLDLTSSSLGPSTSMTAPTT